MVAVRTAGLALESIIGVVDGDENGGEKVPTAVVGREYLEMLVRIANERFAANSERMERFRMELMRAHEKAQGGVWEDKEARRARKRAEGLKTKRNLESVNGDGANGDGGTMFPLGDLVFGENAHP